MKRKTWIIVVSIILITLISVFGYLTHELIIHLDDVSNELTELNLGFLSIYGVMAAFIILCLLWLILRIRCKSKMRYFSCKL